MRAHPAKHFAGPLEVSLDVAAHGVEHRPVDLGCAELAARQQRCRCRTLRLSVDSSAFDEIRAAT